jgi:lipopolysaccharide/colanic/teichoic acid biosynthesis glycosyltransferase
MTSTISPTDTVRLTSRALLGERSDPQRISLESASDLAAAADSAPPSPPAIRYDHPATGLWSTGGLREPAEPEVLINHLAERESLLQPVEVAPLTRAAVRAFDLVVAISALVLLLPLMALVAIAVRVDSSGPLFYGSVRVGRTDPTFRAWKFRSMRPDADEVLEQLLAADPMARREFARYHKLHDDPRLTRVGRFIRRTSLDELPQLINIVAGQMSVVGPRPKCPKDAEVFGPEAMEVLDAVRPGLTGLWQVSGRNNVPMLDRIELELTYVHTRTLFGDIAICGRTFAQLWRPGRHGAY